MKPLKTTRMKPAFKREEARASGLAVSAMLIVSFLYAATMM